MKPNPPLRLPSRSDDAHKGNFGKALLIGASRGMSGSIAMSAIASLRCGAGLVSVAVPDRCLETVATFHPSLMTIGLPDHPEGTFAVEATVRVAKRLSDFSVVGCGPGMTTGPGSIRLVENLLQHRSIPRVLDADAINCLTHFDWQGMVAGDVVLTPHPGELQRLTGVSPADREAQIDAAQTLAGDRGLVIVVKGGPTVVVDGDQRWTNHTGNPGMATAGSGDVLTGVVTALLGQGLSPWDAARLGVWLHGHAGDLAAAQYGQTGMTAVEILDALPTAGRAIQQGGVIHED